MIQPKQTHTRLLLFFSFMISIHSLFAQSLRANDISIKWKPAPTYNGEDDLNLQIVVKNQGTANFPLKDWDLFFNTMYPVVETNNEQFQLIDKRGNLFQIVFRQRFLSADRKSTRLNSSH